MRLLGNIINNKDIVNKSYSDTNYISTSQKGANNGVASLGADGKVPSSQLPPTTGVVVGYYYEGSFYSDSAHTTEMDAVTGRIYIDLFSDDCYRWNGTEYVKLTNYPSSMHLEDITGDGVETTFAIQHNLNTEDVIVSVYAVDTGETEPVDVIRTDENEVTVGFSSAPADEAIFRVMVIAATSPFEIIDSYIVATIEDVIYGNVYFETDLTNGITWAAGGYYDRNGDVQENANYVHSTIGIPVIEGQTYKIVNYTEDKSVYELTSRVGMLTSSDTIDSTTIKGFVVRMSSPTEVYPSVIGTEWTPDYVVFTVPTGSGIRKLWLNVYAPQGGVSYAAQTEVHQRRPIRLDIDTRPQNLKDKKWTSFGDSITYRNTWQPYLVSKYEMVHTNCGIGSTCLAGTGANAFWQDVRLNAVKASDPDFITILGGANDLGDSNITIGTSAEFEKTLANKDKNTFIGAYSYIIENLLTWKPSLKIIILGTTWAHNNGADYSQTLTYTDFSNACKEVAQYYGLEFVDLHGTCGFNKFTMGDSPYNVYSSDHIHPNDAGSKILAARVDEVFETLDLF